MSDPQTVREMTELAIVAGASLFVCLSFVWWQRSLWLREKAEMQADTDRDKRDTLEAHKIELRELDAYNASERRRLEDEIATLKSELMRMQAQRESDWQILRRVLAERGIPVPQAPPAISITNQGDLNMGGGITGGNIR